MSCIMLYWFGEINFLLLLLLLLLHASLLGSNRRWLEGLQMGLAPTASDLVLGLSVINLFVVYHLREGNC